MRARKVFPPVKHVLDKFRHKLPKEELKRLGKDIAKKLVASDYKNKRVEDPTAELTDKQVLKIKKFVSDFLNRAVEKYEAHQRKKASRENKVSSEAPKGHGEASRPGLDASGANATTPRQGERTEDGPDEAALSDVDVYSPGSEYRKRKREADLVDSTDATPCEGRDLKRPKDGDASPPPPPPPPPESAPEDEMTDVQRAFREQEEALVRENEEAQRLEDEANKCKMLQDADGAVRQSPPLAG